MMNTTMSRGKIILIPKPGYRRQIKNYRPIILLNVVYKVQAKTEATRMKPMLPLWIRNIQTGFVTCRSILDNIFLA